MNLEENIKMIKEEILKDNLIYAKEILEKSLIEWGGNQKLKYLKGKIDYLTRHLSNIENYKKEYNIYYDRYFATFSFHQKIDKWFRTITRRRTRKLIKNIEENVRYKTIASEIKNGNYKNILDVGCREGVFCIALGATYRDIKITGIDIAEANIKEANLLNKYKNVSFRQAIGEDIDKIFPENNFDLVMFFEILEHVISPERLINAALNLLKPDGLIAITVPYGDSKARTALDSQLNIKSKTKKLIEHVRCYDYDKLKEMFGGKRDLKIMAIDDITQYRYYYVTFRK